MRQPKTKNLIDETEPAGHNYTQSANANNSTTSDSINIDANPIGQIVEEWKTTLGLKLHPKHIRQHLENLAHWELQLNKTKTQREQSGT